MPEDAPKPPRPAARSLVLALLTAVLALGVILLVVRRGGRRLPVLSELPDFSLTDTRGQRVSRGSLSGQIWIADFIFTRCTGTCPLMTARMARLQKEIPRGVTLVSFTVDPAYDTREILTEYAKRVSKGDGWLFVTGAQSALYTLSTQGFKLAAMEVPPDQQRAQDGPFLHSSRFVLVDRSGRVRGYYDSTDEDAVARLKGDLSRLLRREAP